MKKFFSLILISLLFLSFTGNRIGVKCSAQPNTNTLIESGKVKQKTGNHSGAIFDFTTVVKQYEPQVQKYLKEKEDYDKRVINLDEIVKFQDDIPRIDTGYATVFFLRGYSYYAMGKNNDAMQDFNTAVKINPALVNAYLLRGKLLWSAGKKEDACIDFYKAASLGNKNGKEMFEDNFCWKNAEIAYKNASLKLRLKEYQEALNLIEHALKLCPDSANYLAIRGRAYLELQKQELAMKDFNRAISLNPKVINAYLGRGIAYYLQNQFQECFDDLTKAIQLDSKLTDAYLYRAYACEKMDKKKSALYDYEQVQRLNPASAFAFFKSGLLRKEMGDEKGACNDFKRAASLGHSEAMDYAEGCK